MAIRTFCATLTRRSISIEKHRCRIRCRIIRRLKCQIMIIVIHHLKSRKSNGVVIATIPCDNYKRCSNFVYQLRHSLFRRRCNFLAIMYLSCPIVLLHLDPNLCLCLLLSIPDQSKGFLFHLYSMRLCRLHSPLELRQ